MKMRWIPLEANPQILNKYINKLGVDGQWEFVDVWGLEADMLGFIPRPVAAVVMLYPLTEAVEASPIGTEDENSNLIFINQTIGNACGTMAILHTLANVHPLLQLKGRSLRSGDSSYIEKLINTLKSVDPEKRAALLENDSTLCSVHEENAQDGQTEAPDAETNTNLHFVTFIESKGSLYELDGRRSAPINHGNSSPDTILEDAVAAIKKFIQRDPDQVQFSLMALVKAN